MCVLQGKLVAVGGCDAWDCTNSVEVYDPEEGKWSYLPPMANCRRGAGAAVFRGRPVSTGVVLCLSSQANIILCCEW